MWRRGPLERIASRRSWSQRLVWAALVAGLLALAVLGTLLHATRAATAAIRGPLALHRA